jgi:hypothetical protein
MKKHLTEPGASIIGANIPGTLIGSAPSAGYWLFKTEDDDSNHRLKNRIG